MNLSDDQQFISNLYVNMEFSQIIQNTNKIMLN